MKKILMLILSIMLFSTLTACNKENEIEEIIYVTVYPMQYLVEQIAGDTVLVKRVPGSTVHSESIDWSAKEIIDMINSDLLFYVNGGVDTYIPDNAESTFSDGTVELIDVSEYIAYNLVCYSHEHSHLEYDEDPIYECNENSLSEDPHFWLDPVKMLKVAKLVRDKLVVTYPDNNELYENNFTVLSAQLEKLHTDYEAMAENASKPIITTAMLFTYWNYRYNLEIMSIVTSPHSSESIPSDIIEFVFEADYHEIHYILFEKNTNSPAGDQVLDGLKLIDELAMPLFLHGLGNLTEEEKDIGSTYMSIMYDNLEVLIEATK